MKKILLLSTCLLCLSTLAFAKSKASPVPAIDATQEMETAITEYKQQNYGQALHALKLATDQTRKMRANVLATFLPAAPKDWNTQGKPPAITFNDKNLTANTAYESRGETINLLIEADSKKINDLRRVKSPLVSKPQKLLGYDYVFRMHDPKKKENNYAILYLSKTVTVHVSGPTLTDPQAKGFMGLINIPKLLAEIKK